MGNFFKKKNKHSAFFLISVTRKRTWSKKKYTKMQWPWKQLNKKKKPSLQVRCPSLAYHFQQKKPKNTPGWVGISLACFPEKKTCTISSLDIMGSRRSSKKQEKKNNILLRARFKCLAKSREIKMTSVFEVEFDSSLIKKKKMPKTKQNINLRLGQDQVWI